MNTLKLKVLLFLFIPVSALCTWSQELSKRPNVILILADDLGYGDISHLNSNSKISTPNIDALAKRGISFTNAHAPASVCTPTRYSILTGEYPWRSERKKGVNWVWEGPLIDSDRFTLADLFQQVNYSTACIGKWHLGLDWPTTDGLPANLQNEGRNVDYSMDIQNGPLDLGFQYYFGQEVPGFPPHGFIENKRLIAPPGEWFNRDSNGYDFPFGISGAMVAGWDYSKLMTRLTDKAIDWIKLKSEDSSSPFFLFFTMSAPHTPIVPSKDFLGKSDAGKYGDFVFEMDYHTGRILNTLKELDIAENTLVIFTSDNGPLNANESGIPGTLLKNYAHNSSGSYRGIKSDAWEGGHRIPFIVSGSGIENQGSASGALISQVDLMETLSAITGFKLPQENKGDGFDFSSILYGSSGEIRHEVVAQSGNGILSIQTLEWKLILSSGGGGNWSGPEKLPQKVTLPNGNQVWTNIQLYKISQDVEEQINVSDQFPEVVRSLMLRLKEIILENSDLYESENYQKDFELWEEVAWISEL